MSKAQLLERLKGTGQEHLLDFYDELCPQERAQLASEIESIPDYLHLNQALRSGLARLDASHHTSSSITPPSPTSLFDVQEMARTHPEEMERLHRRGRKAIADGKTAVLLLAGGSGTRLGLSIPKGLLVCDRLPSSSSLFQLHCEKVRRVEQWANGGGPPSRPDGGRVQVFIMTSDQNDAATRAFFRAQNYFGLRADQVHFFQQTSLPCYDEATGRILMASKHRLCTSPGGNGAVYESLAYVVEGDSGVRESMLDRMRRLGVQYIQMFSVDNLLARVADPLFYGHAIASKAMVVVKTTPKASPTESVGVFAQVDGRWTVIEYTELREEQRHARDAATGALQFNHANIACHLCTWTFLSRAAEEARRSGCYHAARKTIATLHGPRTKAVKLELFVFDLFQYGDDWGGPGGLALMQVDRAEDFAPIKNASTSASDTAETATRLLLALHTRWVEALLRDGPLPLSGVTEADRQAALARLERGERGVEISPLVSVQGENLADYAAGLVQALLHGADDLVAVVPAMRQRAEL